MALNQEKLQALKNAGLVKLFNDEKKLWRVTARKAYTYTKTYVSEVRVDDVILPLIPALAVTDTLQKFLAAKKLKQKYWTEYFGDLILDELWDELANEEKT
jgi:hypothetical protein